MKKGGEEIGGEEFDDACKKEEEYYITCPNLEIDQIKVTTSMVS